MRNISKYYIKKFNDLLKENDLINANNILESAITFNSEAGKLINQNIEKKDYYLIVNSFKKKETSINMADQYIKKGYESTVYLMNSGLYAVVFGPFSYSEVKTIKTIAEGKNDIDNSSWIEKSTRFVQREFPIP